ncbi:MAG: methyltransferase domain-containing protein [Alphaproteobacteria bacterium]|nr:methyltransferase domain-containing protein [Alphaproteobacteria bacterium]
MNRKERRRQAKSARKGPAAGPRRGPPPEGLVSSLLLNYAGVSRPVSYEEAAGNIDPQSLERPGAALAAAFSSWRTEKELETQLRDLDRALARQPDNPALHYQRAGLLRDLKRLPEAIAAYRRVQALDPGREDVAHLIAALGGAAAPARASDRYVASLFDAFAESFDQTLVHWLNYRGPEVIRAALDRALAAGAAGGLEARHDIVDLGCGTGLAGPLLKPLARRLDGVDLSPGMLAKAAERRLYDELIEDEICRFLAARPRRYDIAVATDVLVYFGALEEVFAAIASALRPGGLFAFTLEKNDGPAYALRKTGRYAHAGAYVRERAEAAGLLVREESEPVVRHESRQPVPALCYVLEMPPSPQPSPTSWEREK